MPQVSCKPDCLTGVPYVAIKCAHCGTEGPRVSSALPHGRPRELFWLSVERANDDGWAMRRTASEDAFGTHFEMFCGRCVLEFAPDCDFLAGLPQGDVITRHKQARGEA